MIFPLRIVVPLLLLLFAVLISAYSLWYNIPIALNEVERNSRNDLVQLMTRTQGTLTNSFRDGNLLSAREEISRLGAIPEVQMVVLVDDVDTVIVSSRYEMVGRGIEEVEFGVSDQLLQRARANLAGFDLWLDDKQRMRAYYPVFLATVGNRLRPDRVGVLYVEYDISTKKARAESSVIRQVEQFSLFSVGLAILLAMLFHFGMTRRVSRLVKQVDRFRAGEMDARVHLSGRDELARIGAAFDAMAAKTSDDKTRLEEREGRLQAILDNAGDAIITIDSEGFIQTFNPAAEQIFGYTSIEILGVNVDRLMPEPYHSAHHGYLSNYLRSGKRKIIGIGREVEALRKNGEVFPIDLQVTEIMLAEERFFVGIIRDITERKKIERMKSEFISTVSHELRTPLTSIQGSLGLITGGVAGELPPQVQSMLGIAQKNSERLIRLINDILDIEKIESGKMLFKFEPLDVVKLLEVSIESNHGYAEKHGVELQLEHSLDSLQINVDSDRFNQVMANLISNAVKYSPERGVVRICAERNHNDVLISVIDQGSGIPAEFHDKIFMKFSQADASDTREKGGTGLGLSIAKAIVEKHGGEISFRSESGQGAVFYFRLPLFEKGERQQTAVEPVCLRQILLFGSEQSCSAEFRRLMAEANLECELESELDQLLSRLSSGRYLMLLIDLGYAGGDLAEVVKLIRRDQQLVHLPVVAVSSDTEKGTESRGLPLDLVDWMERSVEPQRLVDSIRSRINESQHGKFRILHIEDDVDVTAVVSAVLQPEMSYRVAANVAEARSVFSQESFDLVILDIGLPDGSGVDLLPELVNGDGQPIPVVIFSAYDADPAVIRRVDASLVKSRTTNSELLSMIRTILGTSR
ncbi:hypothetical protein BOW53_11590 [Solemya pervernicosa gill symbiont]|uniref:Sensor protein FixL n=2 Tax=Gammaproteobacteria incertae sedis TaxID=118884 RepID=A0A1T2L2Z0_9GAMM|nr:PAS domain S-box protein [Candidatus Reidiella endopervernicosa]OOZ39449.1 hypothetical protein BOW53_11590 [Solemya pervernicosa gill symbiont]QKQ26700.1 PAS domain S-box protein [Candidatus Reidiella endopervernicosa]